MNGNLKKWVTTVLVAGFGGGVAGVVATLADPSKYAFPRDLGSGKMWPFFLSGAAVAVGAMFLKSPFGQKVMEQAKESQAQIAQTKADLKSNQKS